MVRQHHSEAGHLPVGSWAKSAGIGDFWEGMETEREQRFKGPISATSTRSALLASYEQRTTEPNSF